ncbi:terminase small subunit [Serratia proteamaculans]|uniref:terminase small subunit n=1 Tax=Serratia proteamaculans TaxID=28151 RepID=UPI00217B4D08|nr:terminase small subunit [Serratia proteamaculans]CAI1183425.1 Terminase small subunit [Serratia proteamaculans]
MTNLTMKQEKFCQAYVETGDASEAYRKAYVTDNMKPESIHRKAKELKDNVKVTARISELQGEVKQRHDVTVATDVKLAHLPM